MLKFGIMNMINGTEPQENYSNSEDWFLVKDLMPYGKLFDNHKDENV